MNIHALPLWALFAGPGKIFRGLLKAPVLQLHEQEGKDSRTGSLEGNSSKDFMPMLYNFGDLFFSLVWSHGLNNHQSLGHSRYTANIHLPVSVPIN